MQLTPYRRVLALPGVRSLLLLMLLARIPMMAGSMVLTLHVVLEMRLGFGAAGTVFAASILGRAVGGPMWGRVMDRRGLRPVVVLGSVTSAAFWASAGLMSYPLLLIFGFLSSLLAAPFVTVSRQSLAALVPAEHRRPAYSLDSVCVELSYVTGPVLGVLVVTLVSTQAAIWLAGVGIVCAGAGLWLLNPPLRSRAEQEGDGAAARRGVSLRSWLRPGVVAVLLTAAGTTVVLGAGEVAMVAVLKHADQLPWTSAVLVAWGVYSMLGGLVYGALRRAPGPLALAALLGLCTFPLAFADDWLWLSAALLPSGLLCAPTLASGADVISRGVPVAARGEAMGYHGAAISVGLMVGTPMSGVVIDWVGPAWGFVAAGGFGVAVAAVALLVSRMDVVSPVGSDARPGGEVTGSVGVGKADAVGQCDRPPGQVSRVG